MDSFFERLIVRAATIDELLSEAFEQLPGGIRDAELASRRLAAWCHSSANGDWPLFERRLERDGLSIGNVRARFARVERKPSAATPKWIADAIWIEAGLHDGPRDAPPPPAAQPAPLAFEHLFVALCRQAEKLLWADLPPAAADNLSQSAKDSLRHLLLKPLSALCAPALYERFAHFRNAGATEPLQHASARYDRFIAEMRAGGFRSLFEEKPVLLRLLATITRQWIESTREFLLRLDADLPALRREFLQARVTAEVVEVEGNLSDLHNGGRSVHIVSFEGGRRIVYKPKDLRLDVAWHDLIERLNRSSPPVTLRGVRTLARDGYGWTEFIDHVGCADSLGCEKFFRRSGAWLALLHAFAATDMHQENIVAAGDQPLPIDLEMILQASEEARSRDTEAKAFEAATETVGNSVMMVGLLPSYARSPNNDVFAVGGVTSGWNSRPELRWENVNSDAMRPKRARDAVHANPNLPHVGGRYAKFGDHLDAFIAGFEEYAKFLRRTAQAGEGTLFDGFARVPVRRVIRPTRFYSMLLRRLKSHRKMDDGVVWSAQADFMARLVDWDEESDPFWPLQRAERGALLALNVPHFVSPSDGNEIRDAAGVSIRADAISGLDRARGRLHSLDAEGVAWQVEVIRQNTSAVSRSPGSSSIAAEPKQLLPLDAADAPTEQRFVAEAQAIAEELSRNAVRREAGAAWIGLDWLGDSDVSRLIALGPDLYNGVSGIAIFFAAQAAVTRHGPSAELALAAVSSLRKYLKGRNSARFARSLGIGGAAGLGSVVYALTAMSKLVRDDELLKDAHIAAALFTDELIAADKQLDVMGGSAGAILALLRLHRETGAPDVLRSATSCGQHLLAQPRTGGEGRRSWRVQGSNSHALNGMSHGAAGFAYALASLASATGRDEFARAASECIAFENASYDCERSNWPDLRAGPEPMWSCQWCHGGAGIGLARIAMGRGGIADADLVAADIGNALAGVGRCWPGRLDTLCCGTLGNIEFIHEAGKSLGRNDLRKRASNLLLAVLQTAAATGDFRWNTGKRQFNLGLFRGLAGVGYTALRRVDASLPNVLIWE